MEVDRPTIDPAVIMSRSERPLSGAQVPDRRPVDWLVAGDTAVALIDRLLAELSVSVPMSERLFGQGMSATFDDVEVVTTTG